CYDDLVVVHDGPEEGYPSVDESPRRLARDFADDTDDVASPSQLSEQGHPGNDRSLQNLIVQYGGRFFEQPRVGSLEGQSPFAWSKARFSWILRLDADEIPSAELRAWMRTFRTLPEPPSSISGYTCIWPLWDGRRMVTQRWPDQRLFLFHKARVRFFGMPEQLPVADGTFDPLPFVLEHRPHRKSFGFQNLLFRRDAYRWRKLIARSLLGKPTDLPRWRWTSPEWPTVWQQIQTRPLRTAGKRLLGWPLRTALQIYRAEGRIVMSPVFTSGIHHALIALAYWRARRSRPRT
ncbi:MAG: hypothetical protein ABI680_18715, partial [Chthoniobacteraceae bacterium]